MPCKFRMKTQILRGFLWLCLLILGFLITTIEPGYLDFDNLPDTNFSCVGKVIGGYYADLETNCQMFHVCTIGQLDEPMDIRFLCLNGTVFDQETRVCERVDEVDCSKSEKFYHLNLELYGNTAPPIVEEESDEIEPQIITSSTTTTTKRPTTTTTTRRTTYYTTPTATVSPTTHSTPKVITSNQFPINSGPDIRFNPEEINIRLTPGSPPIIKSGIKTPSVSYQQQAFNGGDARITVTTHTAVYKDNREKIPLKTVVTSSSTQKPKSVVNYGLTHSSNNNNKPSIYHHGYDYSNYQQTENSDIDYHTDLPSSEYYDNHESDHMDLGYANHHMNYQPSNKNPQTQLYRVSSTTKRPETLNRNNNNPYNYQRTEKPPNLQLPIPLFPTLPPLTFSSPAPFSLTRHFESKRSNDQRPRIIVSASASVSDASGRRLNYSLGTIGTSHILGKAPQTYDEYKEDDVGLDPFYHDVPKVKKSRRRKRNLIKSDTKNKELQEEIENAATERSSSEETNSTTPWKIPEYVDDNYEPITYNQSNINSTKTVNPEYEYYYEYYIDDNYEPSMYNTTPENLEEKNDTTNLLATTANTNTEPSTNYVTQETTLESNSFTESLKEIIITATPSTTQLTTTEITTVKSKAAKSKNKNVPTQSTDQSFLIPVTALPENLINFQIENETTTTLPEETTLTTESSTVTTTDFEQTTMYTTSPSDISETTLPSITEETTTENNIESTTDSATITTTDFVSSTTEPITTTVVLESKTEDAPQTTITEMIPTTISSTASSNSNKYYLNSKENNLRRNSLTKPTAKHRFSSPSISISPNLLKLGSKLIIKDEDDIKSSTASYEEETIASITEASLSKSANPTESKSLNKILSSSTTPIISNTKTLVNRRFSYDVTKGFNCLGKVLNKFYEDPRDCRLFHYCTPGYTETQVLDMKFVCDFGTYFDAEKLICTKIKPQRCKIVTGGFGNKADMVLKMDNAKTVN